MSQRSEEWKEARKGKMTASNAATIATNGKGLESYAYEILAEKYSNNSEESFTSFDMKRGIELEEQARMTYELEHEEVQQVGFVEMDEFTGCSPDGLVGEDGGMEIKCPNDVNFFRLMVNGESEIDKKYLWQVQMSLLITGRKWWDLVFYNINFEKSLLVFRIYPDTIAQSKLKSGILVMKELMRKIESHLLKSK
jgi:exodeoxyribonuclease (lambda-induced)